MKLFLLFLVFASLAWAEDIIQDDAIDANQDIPYLVDTDDLNENQEEMHLSQAPEQHQQEATFNEINPDEIEETYKKIQAYAPARSSEQRRQILESANSEKNLEDFDDQEEIDLSQEPEQHQQEATFHDIDPFEIEETYKKMQAYAPARSSEQRRQILENTNSEDEYFDELELSNFNEDSEEFGTDDFGTDSSKEKALNLALNRKLRPGKVHDDESHEDTISNRQQPYSEINPDEIEESYTKLREYTPAKSLSIEQRREALRAANEYEQAPILREEHDPDQLEQAEIELRKPKAARRPSLFSKIQELASANEIDQENRQEINQFADEKEQPLITRDESVQAETLKNGQDNIHQEETVGNAEIERNHEEIVDNAEIERSQEEIVGNAEIERSQEEIVGNAESERSQEERVGNAEIERNQEEIVGNAEIERNQEEIVGNAESERNQEEIVGNAESERNQEERVKAQETLEQVSNQQEETVANFKSESKPEEFLKAQEESKEETLERVQDPSQQEESVVNSESESVENQERLPLEQVPQYHNILQQALDERNEYLSKLKEESANQQQVEDTIKPEEAKLEEREEESLESENEDFDEDEQEEARQRVNVEDLNYEDENWEKALDRKPHLLI